MSEKILKYNNIILHKKKFHKSKAKEPIDLLSVDLDQIVVSCKFKRNDEGFKYFHWLPRKRIILLKMDGYIKYFENGSKNMSFLVKNDKVWDKYDKMWDVIKNKLNIKFHSEPVYEYKVREFNGVIKKTFGKWYAKRKYILFLHCLHNY